MMQDRSKYPHTMHFPWSEGLQNDDKMIQDNRLSGCDVVVTEKMDGENTTMYRDGIHARSLMDMAPHPSRTWVKKLHGSIAHDIPVGWRICGENLFAKHSIHYKGDNALPSYFQVFSIWVGDRCLSWEDTVDYAATLGLQTVPVFAIGKYDESFLKTLYQPEWHERVEGYVVRPVLSFTREWFQSLVAKYVRKGHVQTSEHWLNEPLVKNELCCEMN